ncbi:CLIP domain-containing serine protease B8-like [Culicoides brevitarsis]|uniref:CLIP domain-containing serine protease B8-like n=1 Tax=Culicoides brevitarsis TaxID=469753 RepID=UPI00307BEDFE
MKFSTIFVFLAIFGIVACARHERAKKTKKPKGTTTTPEPSTTTTTTTLKPQVTQKPAKLTTQCGIQGTSDRIVGGNETAIDELPFLALLYYKNANTSKVTYSCGGTLILKRTILTAAHCVEGNLGKSLDFVRLGEWNTKTERDCVDLGFGEEDCSDDPLDFTVKTVLIHPARNADKKENDLAILILDRDAPYTDFIRPICLPTKAFTPPMSKSQALIVAGWGSVTQFIYVISDVKMKLKVDHVPSADCQKVYQKHNYAISEEKQICAGGERDKGACAGDSGGPLMFYDSGKFYISGVVSFGTKNCADAGIPGVYANVWAYMDWINQFAV